MSLTDENGTRLLAAADGMLWFYENVKPPYEAYRMGASANACRALATYERLERDVQDEMRAAMNLIDPFVPPERDRYAQLRDASLTGDGA